MDATAETLAEKLSRFGEVAAEVVEKSAPVAQLKAAREVVAHLHPPDWSA